MGRLLSAAARRVEREWDAHLSRWDLTHAGLPVLAHLLVGPRSQRELAAASGVTEQTMSRVLARLERTGYVRRAGHADDQRRTVVTVTDAGRSAFVESTAGGVADAIVTRDLDVDEVETLRALLLKVASRRSTTEPPGA